MTEKKPNAPTSPKYAHGVLATVLAIVAMLAIIVAGFVTSYQGGWAYAIFDQAHQAGRNIVKAFRESPVATPATLSANADFAPLDAHVVRYLPDKAYNGYTLVVGASSPFIWLIDMNGQTVHQWNAASSAQIEPNSLTSPLEENAMISGAHLYPNGNLLLISNAETSSEETAYGMGLMMIDKDSKLLWKKRMPLHHDIDVGEDGLIYSLSHRIRAKKLIGKNNIFEDSIAVFSADGELLRQVSVIDAMLNSPYEQYLYSVRHHSRDLTHNNSIKVLRADVPYNLPGVKAGQVLVSMRHSNMVAIIDLERETTVWAARGAWRTQHDANFLPDGSMSVFDNLGYHYLVGKRNAAKNVHSRVLEFNPYTMESTWSFTSSDSEPFGSRFRGLSRLTPNNTYVIKLHQPPRIIEVTKDTKEIVWDCVFGDKGPRKIFYIQRIAPENAMFIAKQH